MQGTLLFGLFISVLSSVYSLAPSTHFSDGDKRKFLDILTKGLESGDPSNVHYSILGHKSLQKDVPVSQSACSLLKGFSGEITAETSYHLIGIDHLLGCKGDVSKYKNKLLKVLDETSPSASDIYYHVLGLDYMAEKINHELVNSLLTSILKKDDSVLSLGYSFHVAARLKPSMQNAYFDRIEDAIVQADEVNGRYLQFEGGLSTTAIILSGAYELAASVNKAPAVTPEQAVKFATYFLSRKSVQTHKGIYFLFKVSAVLSDNKFHIPVCLSLASPVSISESQPFIRVKVSNLLGKPLSKDGIKVLLKKASRQGEAASVLDQEFVPSKTDDTLYEFNFHKVKPHHGFYDLQLSVAPSTKENRFVGHEEAVLLVKVLSPVKIEDSEIGVVDADQSSSAKMNKLSHPAKLTSKIDVDYHQKLLMKFKLRDGSGKFMRVHQAFIRLTHLQSKQEIIFVAEPDSTNTYKFDLDVNSKSKEFGSKSGDYHFQLIVGDAVIANPLVWDLGDISITFMPLPDEKPVHSPYKPRPEIRHLFRTPDPRPLPVVSKTFVILCLAPLLLLVIMWLKIGINFSNFTFHPATLGFHVGLFGVFGVLVVFWLKLDMFVTLKYLSAVGAFTFICGNNLLSRLATIRKEDSNAQRIGDELLSASFKFNNVKLSYRPKKVRNGGVSH